MSKAAVFWLPATSIALLASSRMSMAAAVPSSSPVATVRGTSYVRPASIETAVPREHPPAPVEHGAFTVKMVKSVSSKPVTASLKVIVSRCVGLPVGSGAVRTTVGATGSQSTKISPVENGWVAMLNVSS
jgi:hypothetical protein